MGIKDLNQFLKSEAPESFRLVPVSTFSRKRIAVDGTLVLYQAFSAGFIGVLKNDIGNHQLLTPKIFIRKMGAGEFQCPNYRQVIDYVLRRMHTFVFDMYSNGITPVFVLDGPAIFEKNDNARERRKALRVATALRIAALKKQITDTPVLERSVKDFDDLRKLLTQAPPVKPYKDFRHIADYVENQLGVPVIRAPNEAEKFCAFLAIKGIAAACWTLDTDSYAFGAPLVISGMTPDKEHFQVVVTPVIKEKLGLSHPQFVDFCIMLGCDFNSRVPGIGPQKAWKMVKEILRTHPSSDRLIEKITEATFNDLGVLSAERCREIFTNMAECEEALAALLTQSPPNGSFLFNVDPNKLQNIYMKACFKRKGVAVPDDIQFYN
jgi:flap endonuclease-1